MNRVGPLQRAIDVNPVAHRVKVDYVVERLAALVENLDEFLDAALEEKLFALGDAFVRQPDAQAGVEIGHLAQIARDYFVLEFDFGEDLGIGRKGGLGSGLLRGAFLFDFGLGHSAFVALIINFAVAMDLGFELLAQRVDYRSAHAMQST